MDPRMSDITEFVITDVDGAPIVMRRVHEESRTYLYEDGIAVEIRDPVFVGWSVRGTHRIQDLDGKKYIIKAGWRVIEIEGSWSF